MAASQQRWKEAHQTHMEQQQTVCLGLIPLAHRVSSQRRAQDSRETVVGATRLLAPAGRTLSKAWENQLKQAPYEHSHPLGKPPKGWGQAPVLWHRHLWHKQL